MKTSPAQDLQKLLAECSAPGGEGIIFAEPWHAEAVAMVWVLSREGHIRWSEWVDHLARSIATSPQTRGEGANEAYYRQWLGALECLLYERGVLTEASVGQTQEDWRRSYLYTEHGKPVVLRRGLDLPTADHSGHDHGAYHHGSHHHHRSEPVAVSAALTTIASSQARS